MPSALISAIAVFSECFLVRRELPVPHRGVVQVIHPLQRSACVRNAVDVDFDRTPIGRVGPVQWGINEVVFVGHVEVQSCHGRTLPGHYSPRSTLNSRNSRAGSGVCNRQTMLMGRSPSADSSVTGPQAR